MVTMTIHYAYLAVASIAKDGLLVDPRNDPLQPSSELIIVPRSVLDGFVTALHLRLDHPSKSQLLLVMKRHFYALDLARDIDHMYGSFSYLFFVTEVSR